MKSWYKVRDVENDPDGHDIEEVFALDAEDAAEEWAATNDREGDYTIVSGREALVEVEDEDGRKTRFKVRGEITHTYYATEEA